MFAFGDEGGEEGGGECSFAEESAGEIGDFERDGEGVHDGGVSEEHGHAHVPGESEDAAEESHEADNAEVGKERATLVEFFLFGRL